MSIEANKLMNLEDGQVLYNDLRNRHEGLSDDYSALGLSVSGGKMCVTESGSETARPVALDSTGKRIAAAIGALAIGGGKVSTAQSWKGIQTLVRQGLGPKAFPVGTQFRVKRKTGANAVLGSHAGISAVTIAADTFITAPIAKDETVHVFIYDGANWKYNGASVSQTAYGLSFTGSPSSGDEVIVTETYEEILFDVCDHGYIVSGGYVPASSVTGSTDRSEPAMYLLMHHCINGRAMDAKEALLATTEGLTAGAYCFTVANQSWVDDENGKTYYFTLANNLAAGGQGVLDAANNVTLQGTTMKIYAGPESTAVIETVTLSTTEIAGATSLGSTDGTGDLNFYPLAVLGSNNYSESATRQWINSDDAANGWWHSSNRFDRPSGHANVAGLLHGMDTDFINAVRATKVACKTNNTFELPGWTKNAAYTVTDRFFLPSRNELGYGTEDVAEGNTLAIYSGVTNTDRIKYDLAAQSTARHWWLRSPHPSYAYSVRLVNSTGALNHRHACLGLSVAAACVIG